MGLNGLYSDVVEIRKPTISQDTDGSPKAEWDTIKKNVSGRLRRMSNDEKVSRGIMSNVDAFKFYCNSGEPIESTCEIWDGDARYEVLGVEPAKAAKSVHHLEVYCRRITTSDEVSP